MKPQGFDQMEFIRECIDDDPKIIFDWGSTLEPDNPDTVTDENITGVVFQV